MIDLLFTILASCFGFAWGFYQGMIMTQCTDKTNTGQTNMFNAAGVRSHKLFSYYHRISISVFILYTLALIGLTFIKPSFLSFLGSTILAWQLAETGYNYSRYEKLFTKYENLFGFKKIEGIKVYILHGLRLNISLLLITVGLL